MLINDTHVNLIIALAHSKRPNTKVYLPLNMQAVKNYNEITIQRDIEDVTNYEVELMTLQNLRHHLYIHRLFLS